MFVFVCVRIAEWWNKRSRQQGSKNETHADSFGTYLPLHSSASPSSPVTPSLLPSPCSLMWLHARLTTQTAVISCYEVCICQTKGYHPGNARYSARLRETEMDDHRRINITTQKVLNCGCEQNSLNPQFQTFAMHTERHMKQQFFDSLWIMRDRKPEISSTRLASRWSQYILSCKVKRKNRIKSRITSLILS